MITGAWMKRNLQNDLNRLSPAQAERGAKAAGLGEMLNGQGYPIVTDNGAEGTALLMVCDQFRDALCQKLLKHAKAGKKGWDDPAFPKERLLAMLWANATRGDWVDVAAVAMFLHNRVSGWGDGKVCEDNARPTKAALAKEGEA